MKAERGSAWARVVAAELLQKLFVAADRAHAALHAGFRREAFASLTGDLESRLAGLACVSSRCFSLLDMVPSARVERACLSATASETVASAISATRGRLIESMRSGVTGRNRTDTSGSTTHGSAIELRPHLSAPCGDGIGLGGRFRTCDLMLPKHARCLLRYTETIEWSPRVGTIHRPPPYQDGALPLSYARHVESWLPDTASNRGPSG